MFRTNRLAQEHKTIRIMVEMYCRQHHGSKSGLCPDCVQLLDYAKLRLSKCPYQEKKPVCAKCPIHCYKPEMRARIASVMRYSGPRLIRTHPLLAIRHLMERRKEPPKKPGS